MEQAIRCFIIATVAVMCVGCGHTMASPDAQRYDARCEITPSVARAGGSMAWRARAGRSPSLDAPLVRVTACPSPTPAMEIAAPATPEVKVAGR